MPTSASWSSSPAPWSHPPLRSAVAIPMGTVIAIYLSEFAKPKVREIAKLVLELLGGILTIVFGYFCPAHGDAAAANGLSRTAGLSLLSAGLVMGIMIVPTSPRCPRTRCAVPMSLREGCLRHGRDQVVHRHSRRRCRLPFRPGRLVHPGHLARRRAKR